MFSDAMSKHGHMGTPIPNNHPHLAPLTSVRVNAQENNSIYYEPVPEADMLDPLPEAVVMMKPLPSEEAPPPTKTLSFRATGSEEPGDGGENGEDKTDEEIARALHEKLNP